MVQEILVSKRRYWIESRNGQRRIVHASKRGKNTKFLGITDALRIYKLFTQGYNNQMSAINIYQQPPRLRHITTPCSWTHSRLLHHCYHHCQYLHRCLDSLLSLSSDGRPACSGSWRIGWRQDCSCGCAGPCVPAEGGGEKEYRE